MARCYDRYTGRIYNCRSAWNDWVRWVVLAAVVIGFFLLFFVCSCITARRRRKAGRQPFYGTGWAARPGTQPYYYNNNNGAPPPQYSAHPQPGQNPYYGANQGYYANNTNSTNQPPYPYGAQQVGVELQPPQAVHQARGGEDTYAPPAGPPPGKSDGVIR